MDLRTTSAARSHAARSAPAHAAISAAIAAMPSLAWPRPVPGMASPSGITLAAGWAWRERRLFRRCQTSFAVADSRLECGCRPRFCRCYHGAPRWHLGAPPARNPPMAHDVATPIIVDCDPGTDDALALLLAFASPELEVLAVTVAGGNVGLQYTLANA